MGRKALVKKNPFVGFFCFALSFAFLTIPASASGSVRINKMTDKISVDNLNCTIDYPHIQGINDPKSQQKLNVSFQEMAKSMRSEAIYGAKYGSVTAKMDYKVTRNQGGLTSLVVTKNITSARGRNPSETGVTIDTVSGRVYTLHDLFIENADYAATLSDRIAQLESKNTTGNDTSHSVLTIKNTQDFYLTSDKLVIIEKIGKPYDNDCTVKEFAVPIASIKEILKPEVTEKI